VEVHSVQKPGPIHNKYIKKAKTEGKRKEQREARKGEKNTTEKK
jgi:hypothetical protein